MSSGILSTQRALGSTAGYAVFGAVLAATLAHTLDSSLTTALPDDQQRAAVTQRITTRADPHAYIEEIGPGRSIPSASAAQQDKIMTAADDAFTRAAQTSIAVGSVLNVLILIISVRGLPRPARRSPTV
ncbi:hypothetical protein [Streptomyces sp. NPDC127084]|uniref:hypothetical protein n=1 Tax=Streptomyces sp. NPDC127084 TaxID=3347133 RepID=UPI00364D6444